MHLVHLTEKKFDKKFQRSYNVEAVEGQLTLLPCPRPRHEATDAAGRCHLCILFVFGGVFLPVLGEFSFFVVHGRSQQVKCSNVELLLFLTNAF